MARAGDAVVDGAYFAARDAPPEQVCRGRVRAADVYVLVAGFRYGSPVRDRPGLSYTELEFEAASANPVMPRLVFMVDEAAEGPRHVMHDAEFGARQDRFRDRLTRSGLVVATVRDPGELETVVLQALTELPRTPTQPSLSPAASLPELLSRCVVRIEDTAGLRGSGFFIAPQEVLTCAHVVEAVPL